MPGHPEAIQIIARLPGRGGRFWHLFTVGASRDDRSTPKADHGGNGGFDPQRPAQAS
jgi:hypothetical protein